jgi:hypothetical protein
MAQKIPHVIVPLRWEYHKIRISGVKTIIFEIKSNSRVTWPFCGTVSGKTEQFISNDLEEYYLIYALRKKKIVIYALRKKKNLTKLLITVLCLYLKIHELLRVHYCVLRSFVCCTFCTATCKDCQVFFLKPK